MSKTSNSVPLKTLLANMTVADWRKSLADKGFTVGQWCKTAQYERGMFENHLGVPMYEDLHNLRDFCCDPIRWTNYASACLRERGVGFHRLHEAIQSLIWLMEKYIRRFESYGWCAEPVIEAEDLCLILS